MLVTTGCPASNGAVDAGAPKDVAADHAADRTAEVGADASTCADAQALCRGECVDTQSAFLHCGRCSFRCQGTERCVAGACVLAGRCPASCRYNNDCFLCTQEGDSTLWCCGGGGNGVTGLCTRNLGSRCPFPR